MFRSRGVLRRHRVFGEGEGPPWLRVESASPPLEPARPWHLLCEGVSFTDVISTVSGERRPCPCLASQRTLRTLASVEQMGSGLACRAGGSRSVPETRGAGTAGSRCARVEPVGRVCVCLPRVCFFPGASSVVWSERPGFSVPGHHLRCLGCQSPPGAQASGLLFLQPGSMLLTPLLLLPLQSPPVPPSRLCLQRVSEAQGPGLQDLSCQAAAGFCCTVLRLDVCQPPWAAGAPTRALGSSPQVLWPWASALPPGVDCVTSQRLLGLPG